jgi:peptide/nickel transport system substrate-binding protein
MSRTGRTPLVTDVTRRRVLRAMGSSALNLGAAALAPGLVSCVAASSSQDRRNDVLTWGFNGQAETLDPYATNKRTAQLLSGHVIERLVYRDPASAEARPALAKSWQWVDERTVEFTLRDDVWFHDGQHFDADDVLYTLHYIKDPSQQVVFSDTDYGFIKEAQKLSPYVVRLVLSTPTPSAIDRLTQVFFILPKGYHSRVDRQPFGSHPVGTGPFQVSAFESGHKVELSRFERYYPAAWGAPSLRQIIVRCITDPQTLVAEMETGGIDFIWDIQRDQLGQVEDSPRIAKFSGGSTEIYFLRLDVVGKRPGSPTRDKNVRLAILHAINRPDIAHILMGPGSQVLNAPCHPRQFGCFQDVMSYDYNLEKAEAALKRSAYPNGFALTVSAYSDGGAMAEAIVGDLSAIGIKATLDYRETSAILKDSYAGLLPALVIDWPSSGVYDASAMVANFFQGTVNDYIMDQDVQGWLAAAAATADRAVREDNYRRAFEKIANEAYLVPLVTGVTYYAADSALEFPRPQDGFPLMYMARWA